MYNYWPFSEADLTVKSSPATFTPKLERTVSGCWRRWSPDESRDRRWKGEAAVGKASWLIWAEGLWSVKSRVPRFFSVCGQICGHAESTRMKHAIKVLNIVGIPGVCRRIRPIDDGTISIWTRLSVLTNYFFRFYVSYRRFPLCHKGFPSFLVATCYKLL